MVRSMVVMERRERMVREMGMMRVGSRLFGTSIGVGITRLKIEGMWGRKGG